MLLKDFYFTFKDFQAVSFTKALILFARLLQAGALDLCTKFFFSFEILLFPFLICRGFFFRLFRFCCWRGSVFSYGLRCDSLLHLG